MNSDGGMTSLLDVFSDVIRRLEAGRFPYMVVGSIASLVYGEPRLTKDMEFNVIHPTSGLKVDFVFRKNTPHGKTEFDRKQRIELWPGLEAFVAAPEDVILKKLEFFREGGSAKHLLDIKGILAQTEIDMAYLEPWIDQLGLRAAWASAQGA
jgi:hypothetical protein